MSGRVTMADVRAVQPEWFSRKNKRFFNDVWYKLLHGKVSHRPYMVRATYMWSDMFGRPKTLCYRINPIRDDLTLDFLVDEIFKSMDDVKEWLASH